MEPEQIVSLTIAVTDRRYVFQNTEIATHCHRELSNHFQMHAITVYAWTIMPDHAHFCLQATENRAIPRIVSGIKQCTTRLAWAHGFTGQLWQRSFYDHFLRADEDVVAVARYIWNNPVRAGLVADWRTYPYNGSTVYDMRTMT